MGWATIEMGRGKYKVNKAVKKGKKAASAKQGITVIGEGMARVEVKYNVNPTNKRLKREYLGAWICGILARDQPRVLQRRSRREFSPD